MSNGAGRWFAAIVMVVFAASSVVVGVSLSHAQDVKGPDLTGLRDAVAASAKRGANVTDITKALDALEKTLAKGFTPPREGEAPPAQLKALRDAVETAARRGEKVDAIRTELETVEKVIAGKVLTPPKPLPSPDQPDRPPVRPVPANPFDQPFPLPDLPNFGGGGGVDRDLLEKAQQLRAKAFEMMRGNPTDAEAMQLMREAQELMLKALVNGRGGAVLPPDLLFPNPGIGRVPDRARLGVRMERLTPITAEQLGLEGRGVAVTSVVPGSAAEKAGIKPNDIILEFAGKPVSDTPEDFARQVNDAKAGEKVDIVVLRRGKKVELKGIDLPDAPRPVNPRLELPMRPLPAPPRDGDGKPGLFPVQPLPEFRPVPALPNPQEDRPLPFDPNGRANSLSVSDVNGQVTIKAVQDGVGYFIAAARGETGLVVEKITVTDGDKKPVEVKRIEDVPEQYRQVVEKLIQGVGPRKPRQRD